jgi:hypothetical protein
MRNLIAATLAAGALSFVTSYAAPALAADNDPTMHQVYEAAESGHLDRAQHMMDQVLVDHPKSGTAHYVQAQLYAKEGNPSAARSELEIAETLDPGLPHVAPQSVQALKSELGLGPRLSGPVALRAAAATRPFPWGTALVLLGVIALLWMALRRRSRYAQYAGAPAGGAGPLGGPGVYGGPGAVPGGGVGSGIVGGLASGLAVGAGVVAGEELAHHFLDGNRHGGSVLPPAGDEPSQFGNPDMGGSDFGVDDPGSWDGGSGGDGGGGGDWT